MAEQDIHDFLIALSAADVRFVVVGAYALAAHGRVRATGDIDVLVAPNRRNARSPEAASVSGKRHRSPCTFTGAGTTKERRLTRHYVGTIR